MSVAFDSTFQKGASSQASPFSFASNAGTVTGSVGNNSNRVLIAAACFANKNNASAVAVTWNGTGMTQIGSKIATSGTTGELWLFGLIGPAIGANTISVSWTGISDGVCLGAVSVYNADQATGWQNNGTDTETSSTAPSSTVTTTNGNMAVVAHANDNATSTTINEGSSDWIETSLNGNYAMAHLASTGSTAVISWTLGSLVACANIKVDVISASTQSQSPRSMHQFQMRG